MLPNVTSAFEIPGEGWCVQLSETLDVFGTIMNGAVVPWSFVIPPQDDRGVVSACPETHHVPTSLVFVPSTGEGFLFCDCGVDHLAKILFGGPLMARHYASNAGLRFATIPQTAAMSEHRIDSDTYGDGSVPGEPDLDSQERKGSHLCSCSPRRDSCI